MSIKRVFHDPIHKEIVFNSGKPEELMVLELIDTIAFQRLRRIKQLVGFITFSRGRIK